MLSSGPFGVYVPILLMMAVAIIIFLLANFMAKLLSPSKPSKLKNVPYECGEEPQGSAWSQFNVRFYVVGLIFIIFDVESVLMFPVVKIYKEFVAAGEGFYLLVVLLAFIFILLEGIAYCWKKGDLDWVKSYKK
jgi:NADH-quinone oxidoreductase subunit A